MGIKNLFKVISKNTPSAIENLTKEDLNEKIIAIDTSIILYQCITAIRSTGNDLLDKNGKSTSHIYAILTKTLNYLKYNIIPIHIFDGKPSDLKLNVLSIRSKLKKKAIDKLSELENIEENNEEKIKLLKQSVHITEEEMLEAYEIVNLLGVPAIIAPEEADSQCAYLSKNNYVDYILTEDMDLLTFGSKQIIKNFMKEDMKKIRLDKILEEGKITMDQFIDICILLGCDYTETIEGIGQIKAWSLIKLYGSLDEILLKEPKIKTNKFKLPNNFKYVECREYFKNLRYKEIDKEDIILKVPNFQKLKDLLINKYNFNEDKIENMLKFLRKKYNIYDNKYKKSKINKDILIIDDN